MKRAMGWLAAVSLLLALAPTLRADPPASPSPSGSAKRPQAVERGLERLRERIHGLPSALPPTSADSATVGSAAPAGSTPKGRLSLEELARKWAERESSRAERRERHRAELLSEAGQRAGDPEVQAELKLHAARLADLARVEFLAKNARSGADRDQLLSRVAKLGLREANRHHARMRKLLAASPMPSSATPRPSAVPAAPPQGSSSGAAR